MCFCFTQKKLNRRLTCYVANVDNYEIILPNAMMIQDWVQVTDDKGRDVTEICLKHAGPNKDFFGIKTQINHISRLSKKFIFIYSDGAMKTFNNIILFNIKDVKKEN